MAHMTLDLNGYFERIGYRGAAEPTFDVLREFEPNAATDLLADGSPSVSSVDLPKYGVAVLELAR